MSRIAFLLSCLVCVVPWAAHAKEKNIAALQLAILSAPGVVGCDVRSPHPLEEACAERALGVRAFDELRAIDPEAARVMVLVRFREIPSEHGGYFPILLAARSVDPVYLDALEHVREAQAGTPLADFARVTADKIRHGACAKDDRRDARYLELCD